MKDKVLVIEDDPEALEKIGRFLQKEGFEIFLADDAETGLRFFDEYQPDMVITDLKMPKISGVDILRKIKFFSPYTPVIIVTGYKDTDAAISAIEEGALDYIKKPIDLYSLLPAVGRAREIIRRHKENSSYPLILVVEDEESARNRLIRAFQSEGYKVLFAENGEEGIAVFKNNKIDIVLLDIKMPKMDGLTALQHMRDISSDFEAIILTGYGDESDAIRAMRCGALSFIKKPIDLEQTFATIEKAIHVLTLNRSLKYRSRELEIANEIIAMVTKDKEIYIDFGHKELSSTKEFAEKLLNVIPLGLMVVTENFEIVYVNNRLKDLFIQYQIISNQTIDAFTQIGICLSLDEFKEILTRCFEKPVGHIEFVQTGRYSNITLTQMIHMVSGTKQKVMILLMREERKR
ncbi:MAG: response regulator [Desulfobacterales bacterium]|nr:response regulator [Desulfobacterales bacterium]